MGEGKRRVLLVDDEADIVKTLSKRLEVEGFDVLVASDGEEALTKARTEHPDLIILDIMMPKRIGFEVCATLRQDERFRHTPIILYTGKWQEMDERLLRELGADAYVTKVSEAAVLMKQIHTLLGRTSGTA